MSPPQLQLLQLVPQGAACQHELQLPQLSQDVVPHVLQPELQLEQLPHPEYEQQPRLWCLHPADAESAMIIHTANNTAANMTIRRMTRPPQEKVTLGNHAEPGQRNPWNSSPAEWARKVQRLFLEKSLDGESGN